MGPRLYIVTFLAWESGAAFMKSLLPGNSPPGHTLSLDYECLVEVPGMRSFIRRLFYVAVSLVVIVGMYGGFGFLTVELFERGHHALGAIVAASLLIPAAALLSLAVLAVRPMPQPGSLRLAQKS